MELTTALFIISIVFIVQILILCFIIFRKVDAMSQKVGRCCCCCYPVTIKCPNCGAAVSSGQGGITDVPPPPPGGGPEVPPPPPSGGP